MSKIEIALNPDAQSFDWKQEKVLVIGSILGNEFPLWRGLEQAVAYLHNICTTVKYVCIDDVESKLSELVRMEPTSVVVVNTDVQKLIRISPFLKLISGVKGLWFNDLRHAPKEISAFKAGFDRLFMCWRGDWRHCKLSEWASITGLPISYMPQGAPYNQPSILKEKRRCLFIGDAKNNATFHGERDLFMRALNTTVINHRIRAKRIAVELGSDQLYGSARYCIAHSPLADGYNSIRLYNILSYGGLAVVRKFNGADSMFEHMRHLVLVNNAEEAKSILAHLDTKDEIRREIRKDGLELQRNRHTIIHRILNIVWAMRTNKSEFWGITCG